MAAENVLIGDEGIVSVAPETTYGTAGTVFVFQHTRSANMALMHELLKPGILGTSYFTQRKYGVKKCSGELNLAYNDSRAVIGNIMASFGNLSTNDYTLGSGDEPDQNSVTIRQDHGGHLMQFTGCKGTMLRFEIEAGREIGLVTQWLGQNGTKQTPVAITAPTETGIVWESDLGTITVGGTALRILGASVQVDIPLEGENRQGIGGTTILEPQRVGRHPVTGTLTVELSDATGANTIAQYDKFIAGTALGDIVLGDIEATSCMMTGDSPDLSAGIRQFAINFEAQTLVVTTTA